MRTTLEDRTVVRGRRGDPADRLPPNETGLEAQPSRFSAGMWAVILFVSSEAFFFGALFTTYFFLRGKLPAWEPVFGEKPTWHGLPLVNTIELLASSVTMQLAVGAIKKGDRRKLILWLVPTLVLGVLFVTGQAYEYTRLGFLPRDGVFAGVFFTLTGFHGAHVIVGLVMLSALLFWNLIGRFAQGWHLEVSVGIVYWHFVDLVWLGVYATLYLSPRLS